MDLNKFYLLTSQFSEVPICVSNEDFDFDTFCRIVKGDLTGINLPIVFTQISGKKWTDILNPSSVSLYIVSQKLIELLKQNSISGWELFPTKILDKQGNEVSNYNGLSITGKCGAPNYSLSHTYIKQLVPNGIKQKYYRGLHIGFDKWDGSDLFIPEGTLNIVMTKKVMNIIRHHKITNINLQSLADYEIPEFALPKGGAE